MQLLNDLIHKPSNRIDPGKLKPKKILAVQIAGIGDLVLATPALRALKEKFPEVKLDVLTSPRAKVLIENSPYVNRILIFDISRLRNPLNLLNVENTRILKEQLNPLKMEHYDLAISLNNVSSNRGGITLGLLLKSLKIQTWVGRNTNNRAPYFDIALNEDDKDKINEVETKLKLVSMLGAECKNRELDLSLSSSELEDGFKILKGKGKCVAFMPGSNDEERMWPLERFIEVGKWLVEKGYHIVVLGGSSEYILSERIEKSLKSGYVRRLEGKLTLRQTTAVLSHVDLALTNNTGPMHLAAAVNTPLIALFCSCHAERYYPWMNKNRYRLLTKDVADNCSSIGMKQSLYGVTVEHVKNSIIELLELTSE